MKKAAKASFLFSVLAFLCISLTGDMTAYNGTCGQNPSGVTGIDAGSFSTCILKSDGNVHCQGISSYGQTDDYLGGDAIGVATGSAHTCILKSNGNVDCYGYNNYGEAEDYLGGDAIGVANGAYVTCILTSNGNVSCQGLANYGSVIDYSGGDAVGVAVGGYHSCVLKSDGNVDCYGRNDFGQAANYTGGDAIGVSLGGFHSCVLRSNGTADCFGDNRYGQANDYLGGDAIGVATGSNNTCILKASGDVECYGTNQYGEGDDYLGGDAIGVATGGHSVCVMKSDGNVDCYGRNDGGEADDYLGGDAVCNNVPPADADSDGFSDNADNCPGTPNPDQINTDADLVVIGGNDVRLDTDTAGAAGSVVARMSSDENGHVYVSWQDSRDGSPDIYFNSSSNNGASWQSNDIRLSTDTPGAANSVNPQIRSDESGHVYVAWQDLRNGLDDIYFNHSADNGATWQTNDIRLDTDTPGIAESYMLQMTADDNGNVYAVWLDGRNVAGDIYFNYSNDHGATWQQNDIRVNATHWNATSPKISTDGNGHVYVIWVDLRNGPHDIYFNYSSDYGATWQASDIRIDTAPAGVYSQNPEISADAQGHVYVTWQDGRNGSQDVYFNYSSDYGATWQTSDIRIDTDTAGTANSTSVRITNDENGHVYIIWDDYRNGKHDIYFNSSANSGVTWQASDIRIDTDIAGANSVDHRISNDENGHVYVVWYDYRNGPTDIYFNYSSDYGFTWEGSDIRLDTTAQGTSYSYRPWISSNKKGDVFVAWDDQRNGALDLYFNHVTVGDSFGDVCDNCPGDPNPGQEDIDGDGTGDVCDLCPADSLNDADGDGICGDVDQCPYDPLNDADGDGFCADVDNCPNDPLKNETGICGCGIPDTDSDGDGTADCVDQCPADPGKTNPDTCGCGVADTDSDGDGTADCVDQCPADPGKTNPGTCGCGVADTDSDGDGTLDCIDSCPLDDQNDIDGDGICGNVDNCPNIANADQTDSDAPAPITWNGEYDADTTTGLLPQELSPAWTKNILLVDTTPIANLTAEVVDTSALDNLTDMLHNQAEWGSGITPCAKCHNQHTAQNLPPLIPQSDYYPVSYSMNDSSLDSTAGTTVEARLLNKASGAGSGLGISISDGTNNASLIIMYNQIYLFFAAPDGSSIYDSNSQLSAKYLMDTTDSFHAYTLTLQGDTAKAFVDGNEVITHTVPSFVSTTEKLIRFGYHSHVNGSDAEWDYIKYYGGIVPVSDGVGDACDDCSLDPLKTDPGQCGCGIADTDSDNDGIADCVDTDNDNDGCIDADDPAPLTFSADPDGDGLGNDCDLDDDGDGVPDATDNCPLVSNADQINSDTDNMGDACDTDDDNDNIPDTQDNCPLTAGTDQTDTDNDGQGNICDADDDNDTVLDGDDNCPLTANADQSDIDGDGAGDACDAVLTINSTNDLVDLNPGDGLCDAGGNECTVRAAVMEANALAGTDGIILPDPSTVQFNPGSAFILTIFGDDEDAGVTGDIDITDNVVIKGSGKDASVIYAQSADRVLHVLPGISVSLEDLTLKGGNLGAIYPEVGKGAGIYNSGSLVLSRVVISNCYAYGQSGSVTPASTMGGGIYNEGTLTVLDSTVENNTATGGGTSLVNRGGASASGGGIYSATDSQLYITRSLIYKNNVHGGNSSYATGGGGFGAGIHASNATVVKIENSTVSDNRATGGSGGAGTSSYGPSQGGGIYANANLTVSSSTVGFNKMAGSAFGGGLYSLGSRISVKGTIISQNGGGDIGGAGVDSLGFNLMGSGYVNEIQNAGTDIRLYTNTVLDPLADNGGFTQTHALLPGSPAIDAGTCLDISENPITTDQRGIARPSGAGCDIGAFETTDNDADGTPNDSDTCLNDPLKTDPGQCGCGAVDTDGDSDGTADCNDLDDDGDGTNDSDEIACGSDPLNAASTCEVCDGIDNDLNDGIDEGFDVDGDGYTTCQNDCDDNNNTINPGVAEICNNIDDNCDGDVDEGFDADTDGYKTCDGDCDDSDANINPGVTETCDGIDNNCDSRIDEGFDVDLDGYTLCGGDCDDNNAVVNPGVVEGPHGNATCADSIDNDCDGYVDANDEGCELPVADAGDDQSASQNTTVVLDGSGSYDPDGRALTFQWTFVSRPAGSTATLSDPTAVEPEFYIDVAGDYELSLVVNNGLIDSAADTVIVSTNNSAPIADAGRDQSVSGSRVSLDGRGSYDPDGDLITYRWSFVSKPAGSATVLERETSVTAWFALDAAGDYVIELIVNDGTVDSAPDYITVSTVNVAPIADAGEDQSVPLGSTVVLDGTGSYDPEGTRITYNWVITKKPLGSTAGFGSSKSGSPNTPRPSFVADKAGTYYITLYVYDTSRLRGVDQVIISTINVRPVARIEADYREPLLVGGQVNLDGTKSYDADGDLITYSWSFVSVPAGSMAAFDPDASSAQVSITVDMEGDYVISLVVSDGTRQSKPYNISLSVPQNLPPVANAGPDQTAKVGDIVTLDSSRSYDRGGQIVLYRWVLQTPVGSHAVLSDATVSSPTFTVDEPGIYIAHLSVFDGELWNVVSNKVENDMAKVVISTINSAPVADAGPNQAVKPLIWFFYYANLDGSRSYDPDGDALTYRWSITNKPYGSTASISSPGSVRPSIYLDRDGIYIFSLQVYDGALWSQPSSVIVTRNVNTPPNANAGPDMYAYVGQSIRLQSRSYDADGDQLTYNWYITSKPAGSIGYIAGKTSPAPLVKIDAAGTYTLRLVVSDGRRSDTDYVVITTLNSRPMANAGPDQAVDINDVVTLDGSRSIDRDGDVLSYRWSMTSKPVGSNAELNDPYALNPTFTVDMDGDYVVTLVVNDGHLTSGPDSVIVTTLFAAPVADAGADQAINTGDTVTLDGSASSDADGDSLSYWWTIASKPEGSSAVLINSTTASPEFTADVSGTYVVTLMVSDGRFMSEPDSVTIDTDADDDGIADSIDNCVSTPNAGQEDADDDGTGDACDECSADPGKTAAGICGCGTPDVDDDGDGYLTCTGDCDDGNEAINPGAEEICDDVDNNCDGTVDEGFDADSDGYKTCEGDCDDSNAGINPGVTEVPYDGIDQDCSGADLADLDGDEHDAAIAGGDDCDDNNAAISPDTLEGPHGDATCADSIDNDCDGYVDANDEGCKLPVADAGDDQSASQNTTVVLDGSGSYDPDGRALTFQWTFVSKPAGSTATLSDPTAVEPEFYIDVAGDYELSLVVNNGLTNGPADTVIVSTNNSAPIADAGRDQSVSGSYAYLDGRGSYDPDGDLITYRWSLVSKPATSATVLEGDTTAKPRFALDAAGDYVIELIVNDGTVDSAPDYITVSTVNVAPIADAGEDQSVPLGSTVALDGTGSYDPEGTRLTYSWAITSKPSGSTAGFGFSKTNPSNTPRPSFTADKAGTYYVRLSVYDAGGLRGVDQVIISTINVRPVARIEADYREPLLVGGQVNLDGTRSYDADGDLIAYSWSFVSVPAGSTAAFDPDVSSAQVSITVDMEGDYVISLVVSDGTHQSKPFNIALSVPQNLPPVANAGPDQTAKVGDIVTLDSSRSYDRGGQIVLYRWVLQTPVGSHAVLSNASVSSPTFTVDEPGIYIARLSVFDGELWNVVNNKVENDMAKVVISTINSAPIADAGPNQAARFFNLYNVYLNGAGSYDPDGDRLTYRWGIVSRPSGSSATLSSYNSVRPAIILDRDGIYVFSLKVYDGHLWSQVSTTIVTRNVNTPPNADAGRDMHGYIGSRIKLNGSRSSDPDGDPITYYWRFISKPLGSKAVIFGEQSVYATFRIDIAGTYTVRLVVSDGQRSDSDIVVISTVNSRPRANAGPDQAVNISDVVTLDGSLSTDADGDTLSYRWSMTSKPVGSNAELSDPFTANPAFTVDMDGDYVVSLVVEDGNLISGPDSVIITTQFAAPVADAGADQTVHTGDTVVLDGSGSNDADGDSLTYLWTMTSKPDASTASLSDPTAITPEFVADLAGTYVITLMVDDGRFSSEPDSVTIDTDADDDGIGDTIDNCVNTPNAGQEDTDIDGTGDACDECASDPDKTTAGVCGCGVADVDADEDGYYGCTDDCDDGDAAINPGTEEVCDGIDNNCSGEIDDGLTIDQDGDGYSTPDSCTGTKDDCDDSNASVNPAGDDSVCNGLDDDCDGETDEEYAPEATSCGTGACASTGVTSCLAGTVEDSCTEGTPSADDSVCNGIDDDCDGETDEEYAPGATSCGVGACTATGVTSCVAGAVEDSCIEGTPADDDSVCNGIDDDCDGETDEEYVPTPTTCGTGECSGNAGQLECQSGAVVDTCEPLAGVSVEVCDGLDNDCDGTTDEGFDQDNDGAVDCFDNCPAHYDPSQQDIDGDLAGDICDICPADGTNQCDPDKTAAVIIGPDGGTVASPDGSATIIIPPGALTDNITISITETGKSYEVTGNQGNGFAFFGLTFEPEGLSFAVPVTVIFSWPDADNDGIIDGTSSPPIHDKNIIVTKDNVAITGRCDSNPVDVNTGLGCDQTANTFTFQVSGFSLFEIVYFDLQGPVTSNVVADPVPVAIDVPVTLTATVDDALTGMATIASAAYNINGGLYTAMIAQDGSFDAVSETVTAIIPAFTASGVYTICVHGKDHFGNVTGPDECTFLPVYDPDGGFVTGGGWFTSAEGAYYADTTLAGKANFGFVSRYKKGSTTPEGVTEFQFKVADLNFHSEMYEWLVVAGSKAQYKGTGTINGEGVYQFILTGIDADISTNDAFEIDRFRIRIWTEDEAGIETTVYDNGLDADLYDEGTIESSTTDIGGGSIVIHTGKGK